MPIRYDPILVGALAAELGSRWVGCRVTGLVLGRSDRHARLELVDRAGAGAAVAFLMSPTAGQVVPAADSPPPSGGRRTPFRRLLLRAVRAPTDERRLVFDLAGGHHDPQSERFPAYRLHVELHTNQWNVVLVSGRSGRIEAVLWPRTAGARTLRAGAVYEAPQSARRWATSIPRPEEWRDLLSSVEPSARPATLLRVAAWTSRLNAGWVLGDAGAGDIDREGADLALEEARDRYAALRDPRLRAAWLVEGAGTPQPYPFALDPAARPCRDLLDAMEVSARAAGVWPPGDRPAAGGTEPTPEADRLARALRRRHGRVRRRLGALERQLEGGQPDRLRDLGHLLLARQAEVPRGARHVVLDGFDGAPVEVELDARLDAVANAERYFQLARRRDRALQEVPQRMRASGEELRTLEAALAELRREGPSERLWQLAGGRPPSGSQGTDRGPGPAGALPYRTYRSSSGLEIRVGRSARGNDRLTFRHSAPDDIWLHARQASGAHVILRWGRRDQNPPAADIADAAVLAAVHSEARHSGLVAVDWTRRKHVRKPRKAPPGTVVPERTRTVFVEPDPNAVDRLAVKG